MTRYETDDYVPPVAVHYDDDAISAEPTADNDLEALADHLATATRTVLQTFNVETATISAAVVLRIYTVPAVADDLIDLALAHADGSTLITGAGSWRDDTGAVQSERAAIVETVTTATSARVIAERATAIARKYGETAILITTAELTTAEVTYL